LWLQRLGQIGDGHVLIELVGRTAWRYWSRSGAASVPVAGLPVMGAANIAQLSKLLSELDQKAWPIAVNQTAASKRLINRSNSCDKISFASCENGECRISQQAIGRQYHLSAFTLSRT
jgi:hypothetical protein